MRSVMSVHITTSIQTWEMQNNMIEIQGGRAGLGFTNAAFEA